MSRKTGAEFMEKTRLGYHELSDQMKGVPPPQIELPFDDSVPFIDLPLPESCTVKAVTVTETLKNRQSIRTYANTHLTLQELSYLLWATQGVKNVIFGSTTLRTVPSAGARHAFETYLLMNNVEKLHSGLYRYSALHHKLQKMNADDTIAGALTHGCLGQEIVQTCAVLFIWSAVAYRMTWRYGERGYRYLHLDAGHVCQNLYIAAEAVDCGVCAIGAFDDDDMNRTLGLDGVEQFVMYAASVGKKKL